MSQHDYDIAAASGSSVRADINLALAAIATWNSGASAPSTTFARQRWVDTTSGTVKRRNVANSGWIVEGTDDETRVVSRAANTMLDVSDITKIFKATANFTQTFDAVATLGDWWHVGYIVDSGVTVTLDPNGAETIDGATTKVLVGPVSGFIYGNASALFTVGFSSAPATQAEMEAASSIAAMVTPGRQQFHPSAAKGWCKAQTDGVAQGSYNVTSVTDDGTGQATITWNIDFSSIGYCALASPVFDPTGAAAGTRFCHVFNSGYGVGSTTVWTGDGNFGGADPNYFNVVAFGDQ